MKRLGITAAALALAVAACTQEPAAPAADELVLAQEAQVLVEQEAAVSHAHYLGWLGRLLTALRTTDDPEARAFLEQAREYREQAGAALRAGDREEARRLFELAFRAVLSAVIELFPNAPERAGEVVDAAVARIETKLGDREAPRIRRILEHVKDLREEAAAAEDPVTELAINLRAFHLLHRLVHFVRNVSDRPTDRPDRDTVARDEMDAVGY